MWRIKVDNSLWVSDDGKWVTPNKSLAKKFETQDLANEFILQLQKEYTKHIYKTIKT